MRYQLALALGVGLATGLALSQAVVPRPASSQESTAASQSADTKELDVLQASASTFEKAFNAGDSKAIAALFAENAEAVDEDGLVIEGRADIEARFADLFKDFPQAKIEVVLASLRKLGPDVAVEDGYSTTTLDPEEPGSRSPYTIVHVRRKGEWQIVSVRDFPAEATEETAHEQLKALEWLVGQWVDESREGRVETSCEWSEDGNYLLQNYVVKTGRGAVMQGTQRIGWDPLRHTIRSWAFDESGAFTEAIWTLVDEEWIVKAEGVTPDGRGVSATRFVRLVNEDAYQIDSTGLVMGQEMLPDSSVRVVRHPPEAAE